MITPSIRDTNVKASEYPKELKVNSPWAQKAITKGLYNTSDLVKLDEPFIFVWGGTERVNHCSGIHHELYAKNNQKAKVAVFGGEGRNDQR